MKGIKPAVSETHKFEDLDNSLLIASFEVSVNQKYDAWVKTNNFSNASASTIAKHSIDSSTENQTCSYVEN